MKPSAPGRGMALIWGIMFSIVVTLPSQQKDGNAAAWQEIIAQIEKKWPRVPQMSTDELQARSGSAITNRPILIDVRSREEYAVSHLRGAIWAESARAIAAAVERVPTSQPVVLYCSVGVRSSRAADRLMESGRTNVFNLKGSIFQWANEGRRVERDGHEVTEVHPFNEKWGRLLDPSRHPKTKK